MGKIGFSKNLQGVSLHVPDIPRRIMIASVIVALYSVGFYYCFQTAGEPFRLYEEAKENRTAAMFKQRREKGTSSLNTTDSDDEAVLIPSWWAPNAWAGAAMFLIITSHVLFHLMCHWKVWFRALTTFKTTDEMREGVFVQAVPPTHRGRSALCKVGHSAYSGRLTFEFQRQLYEFFDCEEVEKNPDEDCVPGDYGEVRLIKCPVSLNVHEYLSSRGMKNEEQAHDLLTHFGKNVLDIPMPTFASCLGEQLLRPMCVFQVFVSILWLMDDYLSYVLMNIMFIMMLESTSVFQKIKTLRTLNNMCSKPFGVQVYRGGAWEEVSTQELLPGDLMQVYAPPKQHGVKMAKVGQPAQPDPNQGEALDVAPVDCVILRGTAVASEASLTGESVPQMKDELPSDADRPLDINVQDRVHVVFSGTTIINAQDSPESGRLPDIPKTPQGGCLAYVLRTGFNSSQGELLQMIEYSVDKVSADSKEVALCLLILLGFAICSASYVLVKGLEKGDRTADQLLLKCVIILSAVVPRELPMQMAMAVNTALMALMKVGVFCTEPFRVPLAGKLSHCLFDKTGTLTTDTLIPCGIVAHSTEKKAPERQAVVKATPEATMVLVGCHSLVDVKDVGIVGDPIELAAVKGVDWRYEGAKATAYAGNFEPHEKALQQLKDELAKIDVNDPNKDTKKKEKNAAIEKVETEFKAAKAKAAKAQLASVHILQRFHFASKLQRMSAVAQVESRGGGLKNGRYSLVKGSPEIIKTLVKPSALPSWYEDCYISMAEEGMRVLALAYKPLETSGQISREFAEKDLQFAGFIAFSCKSRSDTKLVIQTLKESNHHVAMVTGDGPLTALHVAKEVAICPDERECLLLKASDLVEGSTEPRKVEWVVAAGKNRGKPFKFDLTTMAELAKTYEFMTTEDALLAAVEQEPKFWDHADTFVVFARMSPQGKATVIRELQKDNKHILMCGDGGNDVGALKQADVGLALLGGYGNMNTSQELPQDTQDQLNDSAEEVLNEAVKLLDKRVKAVNTEKQQLMKTRQKELIAQQQEWLKQVLAEREARGEPVGVMAQVSALKEVTQRMQKELREYAQELNIKHGNAFDKKPEDPMEALMDSDAGGVPMVRPGDASIAAPFTSRSPSIKNSIDLVRQGRCTLLSSLQQMQVMMLNCIISAYTLSAISLEGSRSSERQMMGSSWLIMIASLAFSYATPIQKTCRVRPLQSVFHKAIFVSLLGQAAIHLFCMVYAVNMARETMAEGSAARLAGWVGPTLQEVSDFHKKQDLIRKGVLEKEVPDEELDWMAASLEMWTRPFLPNVMNTVVYLVETSQTVAVIVVNYKGQPWMKGVMENRPLFFSVVIMIGSIAFLSWEVMPQLNDMMHLSAFPDDSFRWQVMTLVMLSLVGTFIWDRICVAIFAPEIFGAMLDAAKATTFKNDVLPMIKGAGLVTAIFCLIASGNPIMWFGAYQLYRWQKTE
mmetsp:Transcript_66487/g.152289  ORF Transcript_66487/g.152289 Transcript_66487/m.152289 type:complete len:1462 (-) Transcript_66487:171-4556(-)